MSETQRMLILSVSTARAVQGGWYDPSERLTPMQRMHGPPEHLGNGVGFDCSKDAK